MSTQPRDPAGRFGAVGHGEIGTTLTADRAVAGWTNSPRPCPPGIQVAPSRPGGPDLITAVPVLSVGGPVDGREVSSERVQAIEKAVTAAVLDQFPDAAGWTTTSTNAASGRAWHYYWEDDVEVFTPSDRGGFRVDHLPLAHTPAKGALYDGLNRHVPVSGEAEPEEYRVAITAGFRA